MLAILICVLGFLVLYVIVQCRNDKSNTPLPPGPSMWESLKITWRMVMHNDLHLISEDLRKRFGDIHTIKVLGENLVILCNSRIIRKVLASGQYRELTNDRPPTFYRTYILCGQTDIASRNNNETLAKLRRMVHGAIKLYGDGVKAFEDKVNKELGHLQNHLNSCINMSSVDLDHALNISIARVMYVFLTDEPPADAEKVFQVVADHDFHLNTLFRFSYTIVMTAFPWIRHIPGPFRRIHEGTLRAREQIHDLFLNPDIVQRMKSKCGGILGRLFLEAETDEEIDERCIYGVLTDLVAAGFLSTKGALSGFFLLMLYYPEVQHRIQEEIDENIDKDRPPSLDDRAVLHYTNATILECLRFIGHTPLGVPHLVREEIEMDGMRIPANTTIITNWWSLTRHEKAWDNPHIFKPERFLDESGKLVPVEHPYRTQLLSFGIGKRVCLGESFARSRIFLYVTSILQRFRLLPGENELANLDPTTWEKNSVTQPEFLRCVVEAR